MFRWIAALSAALVLSGCVTTREYVYTDGSYRDGYRERVYTDGSYPASESYTEGDRYVGGSTYYSSGSSYGGDYYYREPDFYSSSSYLDYPYYYSIFQPINSWWYDPYYFPSYYYGVTFYPRNYFGLSLSYAYPHGYGWPRSHFHGSFYSPYRYGWVDSYYDWEPWYANYPRYRNYYPTPRYGSARREAERLASWSDSRRYSAQDYRRGDVRRTSSYDGYPGARGNPRAADYGSRTAPRQDPGTRGFGVPTDVRRTGTTRNAQYGSSSDRQLPSRGFGVPAGSSRGTDTGSANNPRNATQREAQRLGDVRRTGVPASRSSTMPARQSLPRGGYVAPARDAQIERAEADARGYALPGTSAPRRVGRPASTGEGYRRESAPRQIDDGGRGYALPSAPERRYSAPVAAPRDSYAPAPQQQPARGYSAPPAPQRNYSAPAPAPRQSYSDAPSRSESRGGGDRGGSRGSSGGVRRVGSNRDDR
ncbi:hypothetical protein [Chiayiivirga flava]|uniref:Uncharacterized protein n=1 Tax=Chiayiivirga flava TaxID=659595 RepID=A0A7W8FZQ7_9GAMM|nr:hypothetical protein [Chiayiivirga flava]MBB5207459.1 hypothetical protein [Chiayiivirga flava]